MNCVICKLFYGWQGLPALRERWRLDCVVINGENAAGGFGLTEAICDELLQAGADAVTPKLQPASNCMSSVSK